LNSFN